MKWSSYTVENNWLFKPIGLNSAVTWMIEENYTCVQTQVCVKTSDNIIYVALTLSFPSCYHAVTLVALSDVLALPPASSVQHSSSGGLMNISPGELVQVYIFSALHPFTPVHDLDQSLNHCWTTEQFGAIGLILRSVRGVGCQSTSSDLSGIATGSPWCKYEHISGQQTSVMSCFQHPISGKILSPFEEN